MERAKPLTPEQLCRGCDPTQFSFQTTAELEELTEVIGGRVKWVRIRSVDAATPRDVARVLRTEGGGLLVLPGSCEVARQPGSVEPSLTGERRGDYPPTC